MNGSLRVSRSGFLAPQSRPAPVPVPMPAPRVEHPPVVIAPPGETIKEGAYSATFPARRIEAETPLNSGEQIRLTVEVPRRGYLYVIDRELYSDGSFSRPMVIFPTRRIRNGDNLVRPGKLIELPNQTDQPPYFVIKRSRQDQVSEVLTFIVTTKPLEEIVVGEDQTAIPPELYASWEKKWLSPAERYEIAGGKGMRYTRKEEAAGADPDILLTRSDPSPQTIYRVSFKPNQPLMVKVPLLIK
ncbi:MAG TPA: hypothetical protein VFD58_00425 [Blastocatellia bacterium]|nr:hypothetical protein [Blastocatellia bacterium]